MAALERGDEPILERELTRASNRPTDPGETRALADVALMLGEPEKAAAILEQSLARQSDSLSAIHRLLEIQRQRHRMRDVAALDERIFALTADPEALREAADIYASQRRTADRIDALQRLNRLGHATTPDIAELAHRLSEAGARREALTLVMEWLQHGPQPLPAEIIALAAWLSADDDDAPAVARRLGTMIGLSGEAGPLHVLIQTYAERGHSNLSLIAALALDEQMQAIPEVALLLAQLEALQGQFVSARHRLDALDEAGKLLPAGLPMLADLSLQVGDVDRAAALIGSITTGQMPEGLPHRLVDAAFAAGRLNILRHLAIGPIASSSPGSGAVVALVQDNRVLSEALATRALSPTADLSDLGPAFGSLVGTLGLERVAISRLLNAARVGALDDQELSLLIDVSTSAKASIPAVLQALRAQRDVTPKAGELWAIAAARTGSATEVAAWLHDHSEQTRTDVLLAILQRANERSSVELMRVAALGLAGRRDLPDGWTQAEISFAAHAYDPMTVARLQEGLSLIGAPQAMSVARNRVAASLVGARDFTRVAKSWGHSPDGDAAVDWIVGAERNVQAAEVSLAQLTLIANIAPHRAVPLLAHAWSGDPRHLLPLYIAALLRDRQSDLARTVLTTGLKPFAPKQQDAILYDALAGLQPDEALPLLQVAARSGRGDWMSSYQDALAKAGRFGELRAELMTQATGPDLNPARRLAIASRLVELNDRDGAISILEKLTPGLRPSDPVVEQLVFLWGPRADPRAVKWAHDQAISSPLLDLAKWLDHLAYLGAPRTVIEVVEARPAILSQSAQAIRIYGASLLASNVQQKPNLANAIAAKPPRDVANALAQLALDSGQAQPAWRATRDVVQSATIDAEALLLAAQSSASVHRSSEAADLYTRLLELAPQDAAIMIDAGDAMLSARRVDFGRRVLTSALQKLPVEPTTLNSARQRARALLLLKRTDEAAALLRPWLTRYPDDAGLTADLMQARLDRANLED